MIWCRCGISCVALPLYIASVMATVDRDRDTVIVGRGDVEDGGGKAVFVSLEGGLLDFECSPSEEEEDDDKK